MSALSGFIFGVMFTRVADYLTEYSPTWLYEELKEKGIESEVRDNKVYIFVPDATFAHNSCTINTSVDKMLVDSAKVLTHYKAHYTSIYAEGHSTASGSSAYNQLLSLCRARLVANRLVAEGVSSDRVEWRGHGETYADIEGYGRIVFVVVYEDE